MRRACVGILLLGGVSLGICLGRSRLVARTGGAGAWQNKVFKHRTLTQANMGHANKSSCQTKYVSIGYVPCLLKSDMLRYPMGLSL